MTVHSGLSTICAGYLISAERNERTKVATITVTPLNGKTVAMAEAAVDVAARLLAERVQRALGLEWRVVRWVRKRVAGVNEGSGY